MIESPNNLRESNRRYSMREDATRDNSFPGEQSRFLPRLTPQGGPIKIGVRWRNGFSEGGLPWARAVSP